MRTVLFLALLALPACEKQRPTPLPEGFRADGGGLFLRKRPPTEGQWLERFDEPGQTYEEYVASRPVRARKGEHLAFLPVGPFDAEQRAILEFGAEFARLWFDLPTSILPAATLPERGWSRERPWGKQYRTGYFLRHLLPDRRPSDAVCLFGVTMADLYPDDDWHFVFGQASIRKRVGVWSFVRYFPEFYGESRTRHTARRALRRACRLVVHEAGHTFGMLHCIEYECVMNGSNNLAESDSQPLHLCPVCLSKLAWNRGFDPLDRYRKLLAFFRRHGLDEEARWTTARLADLERD